MRNAFSTNPTWRAPFRLLSRAMPLSLRGAVALLGHIWIGATTPAAAQWEIESGERTTLSTFGANVFTTVTFDRTFNTTPVVVVLATSQGGDPSDLRIRNITSSGFEVTPVEPPGNDGPHVSMTFHYVAMTPGVHILPTGETVVAGTHTTSTVQRAGVVGGPSGYDTVSFGTNLGANAAIVASIQTTNSETASIPGAPSTPWLSVVMDNPSATSVQMALERSEVASGTVLTETIGYIAFPTGASGGFEDVTNTNVDWSASTTSNSVVGFDNACVTNSFTGSSFSSPRVVAGKVTRNGGDGGWFRRCSLSGTQIGLQVDEDIANDGERSHTNETASLLAFSRSFHAEFQGLLTAAKSVEIMEDPVNGPIGAFAIPGARARYTVDVTSVGSLPIDDGSVVFIDALPPETSLIVADIAGFGSGPVLFTDSSSGLTYNFSSLSNLSDDISFSNNGAISFTYTPTEGGNGADPAVTHIRINPQGRFAPETSGITPAFQLQFDVIVE
ncbi:MAG: hypothetical protein AAFR03_04115 [Pseudomonadota bacterium]